MKLLLKYNCDLCTKPWWKHPDVWLPSLCPHPPSLPPQRTRPTWLQTSLCCKIPRLIIQDPRLGSASRHSLCCIVHPTETLLGSFCSSPPHRCSNPSTFLLCVLCARPTLLQRPPSPRLSPLLLILLFWLTSFLFLQLPPIISNIKTLTAFNAAAWNLAQEYNRKPAPRKEVNN